ncbi:hypothetical protein AB0K43_00390 [Kitasatospora sp. NPDC049258]|uniref:hypothetical protein n=1 Tax=Kitasatospora sp. NPDC049258 TaxID=3155394 RepID=UPI00343E203F
MTRRTAPARAALAAAAALLLLTACGPHPAATPQPTTPTTLDQAQLDALQQKLDGAESAAAAADQNATEDN